jgi:predicted DNA-binding protein (MmcQ/YjbR family)
MNFITLDTYLRSKTGVTFDYPFDEEVRVYRVMNKIFALTSDTLPLEVNLKCDPVYALELRSIYQGIRAGYHMNKKHWNTLTADQDVNDEIFHELIDHSYDLIVQKLTKRERALLKASQT